MKKIGILSLLILLAATMTANPVDKKKAKKAAENFILSITNTRIDLQLIDYVDQAEFPNFYVFGTDNSFVIISADDCVQPVLGYSKENPFGTEKMPENLFCWLKSYDEQIAYAAKIGQKATNDIAKDWKNLLNGTNPKAIAIIGPLIETNWAQGSPYNLYCPGNKATGCVATAMAQIMKYHEYPAQGFGSHAYTPVSHPEYGEQSVSFGTTTYNWDQMLNTYSSNDPTQAQKEAVATLMYHCGVSVNMNYGNDGNQSGAITADVVDALKTYFNYEQTARYITRESVGNEAKWIDILKNELYADPPRPILYRGTGHAFICDGHSTINNNDMFHFNWGWGDDSNGDFSINSLVASNFNSNQAAIIGIQPIAYDEQPTNLNHSVSGRTVNLNWNRIESASSYNVYRNYNLIANTTSCSFTDANVNLGTHMYYVRGVKNDSISLPSNTSTATVTFGGTMEELKIDHLQASHNNGNVTLEWSAPYRLNYMDYHSLESEWYYTGTGEKTTLYWGARFPASMLTEGTTLNSVSYLFNTAGEYSTSIYQCTGGVPSGEPVLHVTRNYPEGWNNVVFPSSITINPEKDLWVVFKSTDIPYPITLAELNSGDGNYYSEDGDHWYHFSGCSFFISANLSNGNFTYNIYDGNTKVVGNLSAPSHTLSGVSSGVHQYSVKVQKGEETSEASNKIGFTLGTASVGSLNLGDKDQMTLASGSSLTVNGEITNTNPDNLILEDGAQLISDSPGVMATVLKNIKGFKTIDNKGNWYLIASPMTEQLDIVNSTNLLTTNATDYDLYIFDQSKETEWLNYKQNHFTTIDNKTGYLYANKDDIDLAFAGTLNNTEGSVDLTYSTDYEFLGFNLVGNPFPCNATISRDFYRIVETVEGSKILIATDPTIAPMEGIFVKATDIDDNSITFSKPTAKGNLTTEDAITMSVAHGQDGVLDIARIRFSGETDLEKLSLREGGTELFIPQNGKKYALVVNHELSETPISFKAATDGTYTLTVSSPPTSNLSPLTYLHLIDNLTGADIDLLQNQSYTFEAKADDYESRFRLLFNVIENTNTNTTDITDGVTQVLDMTGRIVGTNVNENMKPGVYILRTINGNEIKTEKIIIK